MPEPRTGGIYWNRMDDDPIAARHESLLAHVAWIRKLARRMVVEPGAADDLAQDAFVVALEREPRDSGSFRAWLEAVMRNLVRQRARGDGRRLARERLGARKESLDGGDDLVARAELQRRIVEAVLDLEEPYRSTILRRYFEEEPPREIARRLGLPVTTVQSRLKHGLRRLRIRLDDTRSDHAAWVALLAPLPKPAGALLLATGGLIVNAKLLLLLLSFVIAALMLGVAVLSSPEVEPLGAPRSAVSVAAREGPTLNGALETAGTPSLERAPAVFPPPPEPSAPAVAAAVLPESWHARGRVLDASASPLAGLALEVTDGATKRTTRSGLGGIFEVEVESSEVTITCSEPRFATIRRGIGRKTSSFEPIVIVAPAIDVGGAVLDSALAPLKGAHVSLALPEGFETRFGEVLEATRVISWSTVSEASGSFALARLPQVQGAFVRAQLDGYEPAALPEPQASDPGVVFVLGRPRTIAAGALRGRVLDPDGRKVADARVAVGLASTVTDDGGEFALELTRALTADRVTAVKPGFLPAVLERPEEPSGGASGWPDEVVLVLGGPPLSIRGRVEDEQGAPRGRVCVWIADPSPFGLVGGLPVHSESLVAGAAVPRGTAGDDAQGPEDDGDRRQVIRSTGGEPNACWYWVVADEDGRFELGGLTDREYKLRVFDKKTLQTFTSKPIAAGQRDARIVVPPPPTYPRLAGRVLTVGARPVAGARLVLRTTPFETHARVWGGSLDVVMIREGGETMTDAEGRFEFHDVPRENVYFAVRSDRIVPCDWNLPAGADPVALEVRVDARCQLEVRLQDPVDRADEISLVDDAGESVELISADQQTITLASSVALVDGRSGVLSASSRARTLELRKHGKVVATVPVALVPDVVVVLQP